MRVHSKAGGAPTRSNMSIDASFPADDFPRSCVGPQLHTCSELWRVVAKLCDQRAAI